MPAEAGAVVTPDLEWSILVNATLEAMRLAAAGDLVDGHDELVRGMRRAEQLVARGEAGPELVLRWQLAIDGYCGRWGVPLAQPPR